MHENIAPIQTPGSPRMWASVRRGNMAKNTFFDWYEFLARKVLRCKMFHVQRVYLSCWADRTVSQGTQFDFHTLFANSWDFPVQVNISLKVTPKVFFATKKKAERLVLARDWQILLDPGQVALVTAPGYASANCCPCSIQFKTIRVRKTGAGRRIWKRRGKPAKGAINPLGLLFLPFGFILISTEPGPTVGLEIPKNKALVSDDPEDTRVRELVFNPVWSMERPGSLRIGPLIEAYYGNADAPERAEIEDRCKAAFSKWADKHLNGSQLGLLRAQPADFTEVQTERELCLR
jgi:hypothetical protein